MDHLRLEWRSASEEQWRDYVGRVFEALAEAGADEDKAYFSALWVRDFIASPKFEPDEDDVAFFARMVRERTDLLAAIKLIQRRLFVHRREDYPEGRIYRQMREPLVELRRLTKDALAASLVEQAEIGRSKKGAPPSDLHRRIHNLLRCWNNLGLPVGASQVLRRYLLLSMEPIWHTKKLPDTFPDHVLKRAITEWNKHHKPGQKPGNPEILAKSRDQ